MHERAPVGMAAAELLATLELTDATPTAVTVGVAADVDLEIARDAWESAVAGSRLEGVAVEWVVRRALLVCLTCGEEYLGEKLDRCPVCAGDGLVVEDPPVAEVMAWSSEVS